MGRRHFKPEQSDYRWQEEYGGMRISQANKPKDLKRENTRLEKLVAEQALDKAILEEAPKDAAIRFDGCSRS